MMDRRGFLGAAGILAAGAAVSAAAGCAAAAEAGPREILLIRHGEEPDKGSSPDLIETGRRRADALIRLFPARFPTPQSLFAARSSKHSSRAVETLEPLAKALDLAIDDAFDERDYASLARTLLTNRTYRGSCVLVCWLHDSLEELAGALGVARPPKWSSKRYDRIWQIEFTAGGATLEDLPQSLLPGDSA